MKKAVLLTASIFAVSTLFSSCIFLFGDHENTKTESVTYDGKNNMILVDDNTTSVILDNVANKSIMYTTINTSTDTYISSALLRTVNRKPVFYDSRAVSVNSAVDQVIVTQSSQDLFADGTLNKSQWSELKVDDVSANVITAEELKSAVNSDNLQGNIRHYTAPAIPFTEIKPDARVAGSNGPSGRILADTEGISYKFDIDDVKEKMQANFWLDNCVAFFGNDDFSPTFMDKKTCTLAAIGKDGATPVCYVWVDASCYDDSVSSGKMINENRAREIADAFVNNYKAEHDLCGYEWDGFYYNENKTSSFVSCETDGGLKKYGPTGNIVNIVIYDIGNDYGKTSQCGVLGYFTAKDYMYHNVKNLAENEKTDMSYFSNLGKFFYIDSAFCNHRYGTDSKGNEVDKFDSTKLSYLITSTLFHEFQHMINYKNKVVDARMNYVNSWYNEMLSMLVEDAMAETLGVPASSQPRARLSTFNSFYYLLGLEESENTGDAIYYATGYGFGSWLVRNFGGAELIRQMESNSLDGMDSVVDAVKKVTGKDYSKEYLLKAFAAACSFRTTFALKNDITTHYIDMDSGSFKFGKINLWGKNYNNWYYKNGERCLYSSDQQRHGPVAFYYSDRTQLPPQGFFIRNITSDTKNSSKIMLNFNKNYIKGQKTYIVIQDSFDITGADPNAE